MVLNWGIWSSCLRYNILIIRTITILRNRQNFYRNGMIDNECLRSGEYSSFLSLEEKNYTRI